MSTIIDRKFRILAANPCKAGRVYTEREGLFFCAHDAAVPAMLVAYANECERLGANREHIESILLARDRVLEYQRTVNVKTPDTETDCEIDRCIGGIGLDPDPKAQK